MPKRTFTETWIKNLKPAADRQDFTEAGRPGFMLRVWPGGQKTFVLRYFRDSRSQVMTLGQWPTINLSAAHEEHTAARKHLSRGLDPIEERERETKARETREQHEKASRAVTIRNVIAEWAWHYARKHRKRPREAVRLLKVYLGAPWKGRPVRQLVKRDVVTLLDRIVARGSLVMANRIHNLGSQVFTFGVARDLITTSPWVGVGKPGGKEESSERWLTSDEVKAFWKALDAPGTAMSAQVRLGLKLILVTAQRPGEVATARFDAFDLRGRVWIIPEDIAKNERTHYVPLTALAVELVEQLRGLANDRPHLLPSQHSKLKRDEPISERALSRALKNNHSGDEDPKLFGLEPFTPHDLRRTASTHMTSLGIPRLHVKKLLNHSDEGDTTGIYDRHHYWAEKQHAVQVWADELQAIIAGKKPKVVPIGKERRA